MQRYGARRSDNSYAGKPERLVPGEKSSRARAKRDGAERVKRPDVAPDASTENAACAMRPATEWDHRFSRLDPSSGPQTVGAESWCRRCGLRVIVKLPSGEGPTFAPSPAAAIVASLLELRRRLHAKWYSTRARARAKDGDRFEVRARRIARAERLLLSWWAVSLTRAAGGVR